MASTRALSVRDALGVDAAPLWFKPDDFLNTAFNAEAYVSDLKRYVPLDALAEQLSSHAEALRARLVEVVNEDYDEFVSLSTKLVDVDAAASKLEDPLRQVLERLQAARAAVFAQASALQEGLARRQAVAAARSLLELAQDAVHVMAKIEKLLSELPAEVSAPTGDAEHEALEAQCRLLDRLASEISRINFYAQRGAELAAVRALEPRRERAAAALQAALDGALAVVLEAQNPVGLGVLLHAYGSLGWKEAAEEVVRHRVVAPIVAAAVEDVTARHASSNGTSDTALSFVQVLPSIENALRDQAGPFFQLALSPAGGAAAFDFLGGAVLPESIAQAELACGPTSVYSPGLPDSFYANYTACSSFLQALEGMCVTTAQVERLRSCQSWEDLKRRWNVAVYFSLRFQDVAGALEEVLMDAGPPEIHSSSTASTSSSNKGSHGPSLRSDAAGATWDALEACVSKGVFLRPLGDKFTRLAAQIIARFATWVREGVEASTARDDGGDGAEEQAEQHADGGAAGAAETKKGWKQGATAEQLVSMWQDVKQLSEMMRTEFAPRLSTALGCGDSDSDSASASASATSLTEEAVAALLADAEVVLDAAASVALNAAAASLVERCCGALKQLRGIVATFRMTQRAAPTRPAQYATAVLAPLQAFLASENAANLVDTGRKALSKAVVEGVAERYSTLAGDTLATVRKTESSLRRLKSRKEGGESGGAGGAQDTDQLIALQLQLDVEEFGRQAMQCGVKAKELATFKSLQAAVAPLPADADTTSTPPPSATQM